MTDTRETVVSWLRDAHAMEAAAVDNIETNIDRFEDYPTVQQVFRDDLEVSLRGREETAGGTLRRAPAAGHPRLSGAGALTARSVRRRLIEAPSGLGDASAVAVQHLLAGAHVTEVKLDAIVDFATGGRY